MGLLTGPDEPSLDRPTYDREAYHQECKQPGRGVGFLALYRRYYLYQDLGSTELSETKGKA